MNKLNLFKALATALLFGGIGSQAFAVGTPAGTEISNTATVNYSVDGGSTSLNVDSPTVVNRVAEIIDVTVISQNSTAVTVGSGDTDKVLTYLVTNTGNGVESFDLTNTNSTTDDFDPTAIDLYIDNGDGVFTAADTLYDGTNDPVLDANSTTTNDILVFQVSDIGAQSDGAIAELTLSAESNTGTGTPGQVLPNAGDDTGGGNVDAIIGTNGADDSDNGSYLVAAISITVTKTGTVSDPFGGTTTVPGSEITYTVTTTIAGTGTATSVQVVDPVPANTTYKNNSLVLDSVSQSDSLDSDAGDFNGTTASTITVSLGDVVVSNSSSVFVVVFKVTID